jgi:hypothetical protein
MEALIRKIAVLLLAGYVLGCQGTTDPEANFVCAPERFEDGAVIVLTTNYETSSIDLFHPNCPDEVRQNRVVASGDAVLRRVGNRPIVVNRGAESNLMILNQELEVSAQIPLPGCGPHDVLALDGDVLLVSCYESASLFRVFLPSETVEEVIDLQDYAGSDGLPEMDALAADDRFIYLTLQNLDRQNNWLPEDSGKVLIFNRDSLELENEVTLPCDDPYTQMVFADESSLLVGCAGTWAEEQEGAGLVALNTQTLSATLIYTPAELLGRPTYLDFIKDEVQMLVTATPSSSSAWDVETMQVLSLDGDEIKQVYSKRGFSLGGVRAWAQNKVLIAQRTFDSAGGVLLLNTNTAEVEARWTTGLLPSHFMIAQ